ARAIAEAIDELDMGGKAVSVYGIGCSDFLYYTLYVDTIFGPHGRAPDIATAAKRAYPDNLVFVMEGDGALMAIGAESFLGALTRAEKITVIMFNNTVYGTTGGQLAPTTLVGQVTGTTPKGREPTREGFPTHTAEMVTTFKGVAYSARGAFNNPYNYERTKGYIKTAFQKQIDNIGLSFVEALCACPTNWHMTPEESLKWIEEEMIREFPLGEFKNVDKIE
ncbi:unnamed protein product, partial [marine sediment metagenome]